jgi:hypothetical protein
MKKICFKVTLLLLSVGFGASHVSAQDNDTVVKFKGGIGVIPVSSGEGEEPTADVVNRNIVRSVQPAGQIWVIRSLEAQVKASGDIKVEGKGLILGGGNNAGRATGQRVFATLICETAGFVERNTTLTGVPLTTEGDFKINDVLDPWPSADCPSPMLLIRNAANRGWFAAGILDE